MNVKTLIEIAESVDAANKLLAEGARLQLVYRFAGEKVSDADDEGHDRQADPRRPDQ